MSAIDRRGRAAGKGGVSLLSLRRIDADAARASRVRRGDAPAIDGRESRPPRRDLWAPETRVLVGRLGAEKTRVPMLALACFRTRARWKLGAETRRVVGSRHVEAMIPTHLAATTGQRRRVCCASRAFVHGDEARRFFSPAAQRSQLQIRRGAVSRLSRSTTRAAQKIKIISTPQSVREGFVRAPAD